MNRLTASTRLRPALIAVTAFAALVLCLLVTNPDSSPLIILLLPFLLLFIVLYNALIFLIGLIVPGEVSHKHTRMAAIILGFEPVLLLLLASINQLTVRDAILSLLLISGFAWYVNRSVFKS